MAAACWPLLIDTPVLQTPYLKGPLALDVLLDPLQPVRVLLLPHALVDLGAQLLGPLQGFLQVAAVAVALRRVFQDLREVTVEEELEEEEESVVKILDFAGLRRNCDIRS